MTHDNQVLRNQTAPPHVAQPDGSFSVSELCRRDAILEAIVDSAREIFHSSDITQSVPRVLELIGRAIDVERVHLLVVDSKGPPELRHVVGHYLWTIPDIFTPHPFAGESNTGFAEVGLKSWPSRLAQGDTISGNTRDFDEAARNFFDLGGILSTVVVPVFVDGGWRGIIAFDACRQEREWLPAQIDTLKILAELVGAGFARAERQQLLADANHIIENSPVVLFRVAAQEPFPLIYVSRNIRQYGYEADELLAAPNMWRQIMGAEDPRKALANAASLADGGSDHYQTDFHLTCRDGSIV